MAILASEIKMRLSTQSGTAGNTLTSTGSASLGKYISTTDMPSSLDQFFPTITGAQNAASQVDYLCVFVYNSNATLTLTAPTVYLSGGDPAGGANVAIAVDTTAASAVGSATAQALIATSTTAPGASITGLAYSTPTTAGAGIALGNLAAGQCRAIWIRRSATNSAATSETITLAVNGSTPA